MDTKAKASPKQLILHSLRMVGFVIWAISPLTFSFILNLTQELTPIFVRWILAGLWIIFTFFSIKWIWRYYLKVYPDPMPKMRAKDIGIAVGLFLFLRVVAIGGTLLNQQVFGHPMTSNDEALLAGDALAVFPIYFLLFNLTIGIFAPILEELVFRGIFTHLLFSPKAKWLPAVITSAIFSLMHGLDNIITFSMYFIIALTLFFAYQRRGTIKDSIWLHILNNSLAMIISIITYLIYYF